MFNKEGSHVIINEIKEEFGHQEVCKKFPSILQFKDEAYLFIEERLSEKEATQATKSIGVVTGDEKRRGRLD